MVGYLQLMESNDNGQIAAAAHLLEHAVRCITGVCEVQGCFAMKKLVHHMLTCSRKRGCCPSCRQLLPPAQVHASRCQTYKCPVPSCHALKHRQSMRQQGFI